MKLYCDPLIPFVRRFDLCVCFVQTIETAEQDRLQRIANTTRTEFKLHQERWGEGGIPKTDQELSDFSKRCQPREYFLSQDRDLVRAPDPTASYNFSEIARQCDEKIYQIFGERGAGGGQIGTLFFFSSHLRNGRCTIWHVHQQWNTRTIQLHADIFHEWQPETVTPGAVICFNP